jgi:hypothetical protein
MTAPIALREKTLNAVVTAITVGLGLLVAGCMEFADQGLTEQTIEGDLTPEIPEGWDLYGVRDGQPAHDFIGFTDSAIKHGGQRSAGFLSVDVTKDDDARLVQYFAADNYRGKRVRFSGYVRTNRVNGWAGLRMRVDTVTRQRYAFDDSEDRAIVGTTDWARHDVVLDVPEDGAVIYIGVHMFGRGQVWLDDCTFETVGDTVATTDRYRLQGGRERTSFPGFLRDEPVNLDFDAVFE